MHAHGQWNLKTFSFYSKRSTLTDRELAEKLKRDNATLTEAIKRLRAEAEEVARREGEAAEQVKSSVQVAEALRMEKAELEYEVKKTLRVLCLHFYRGR